MNKEKTICIIHHATMQGGGSKSLIDLANMLKENYRVIVCIPRSDSLMKKEFIENGLEVFEFYNKIPTLMSFSGGPPLVSKSLIKTFIALRKANRFCDEIMSLHPDIVFYNSIVSIITARYLPRHVKKICIVRETLKNRITLKIYKGILEKYFTGACFIAGSEMRKFDLKKAVMQEIPDSLPEVVDVGFPTVNTLDFENKAINLLFLGGAQKIKGLNTLLKSLDYIDKEFTLTIAGELPRRHYGVKWCISHFTSLSYWIYLNRLNKLLAKKELDYDIKLTGYCKDISKLINSCDVVIFPSANVHQPRPCIEAGYYGKPIILSDFKETSEFFKDNYNALTFKVRDYKMLGEKINELFREQEFYFKIAKNNYKMSFSLHNYDLIKKDLNKFMGKIL